MKKELELKVEQCANAYSINKSTNKAYKKIFAVIFKANIIDKNVNEYGYSEIEARVFQKISSRKYKDILLHQYNNGLIYTNLSLKHTNTR
jgi:hypothetical protein